LLNAFLSKEERIHTCHGGDHRTPYECSVPALLALPDSIVNSAMNGMLTEEDPRIRDRAQHFLSLRDRSGTDAQGESPQEEKEPRKPIDVEALRQEVEKGVTEERAFEVVHDLSDAGTMESEGVLILLLSHASRYVRRSSAKALGELGSRRAIREITRIYTWTEHNGVQCAGQGWYWYDLLIALDNIGTAGAANALVELLQDPAYPTHDMGEDLLFEIVTKYGDVFTLHMLEEYEFPESVRPFVGQMVDRLRFLLSLSGHLVEKSVGKACPNRGKADGSGDGG
jgi:hypothetical protein